MSLPILVPTTLELPLLGMEVHARLTCRRLQWRVHAKQGASSFRGQRCHRFVPRTSTEARAERLAHWQWGNASLVKLARPPAPVTLDSLPGTRGVFRNLLRRGELLLTRLLRRRQHVSGVSPSALEQIASSFDASTWRVTVEPAQRHALAFMLISMYWRGCRHPASLSCPPMHPSTALVRWISSFPLNHQVGHGRDLLDGLVAEEARIHDFACELVERLVPRKPTCARAIPLLPEMLRAIEPKSVK